MTACKRTIQRGGTRGTVFEQVARVRLGDAAVWALADSWGPELRYLAKAPEPGSAGKLYAQIVKVYDWVAEQTV